MAIIGSILGLIILLVIAGFLIIYLWYVAIISRRNSALEALSSIDVQLKKRHDLIPNILTIAKKFMEHERGLLSEITALRARTLEGYDKAKKDQVALHLQGEEQLSGLMGQLLVSVENYPDLKSDQTMTEAQRTYSEVEGHISAARRFYNSAVRSLNNSVQIFPGTFIAILAGVESMPYFEAEEAVHEPVNASDYLQ